MSDIIFSVDVETSGPTPGVHHLLSIGAVVYDCDGYEYAEFSANIVRALDYQDDPDTTEWWRTQGAAQAALKHDQQPLVDVMADFGAFVRRQCMTNKNPVFLADPVVFDYPWINWAFGNASVPNPFHFNSPFGLKVIDLTSFAMGGLGMENTKRHEILNELDVGLSPHTHIAVEDARHQGELFFKIAKKIRWPRG